jgi:hypothetical protein
MLGDGIEAHPEVRGEVGHAERAVLHQERQDGAARRVGDGAEEGGQAGVGILFNHEVELARRVASFNQKDE